MGYATEPCRDCEIDSLPDYIIDAYEAAETMELIWHILDVFNWDTSLLNENDFELLFTRYDYEISESEDETNRSSACRAFAWFYANVGGQEVFNLPPAAVSEWLPASL